jgi:hypothetical protein
MAHELFVLVADDHVQLCLRLSLGWWSAPAPILPPQRHPLQPDAATAIRRGLQSLRDQRKVAEGAVDLHLELGFSSCRLALLDHPSDALPYRPDGSDPMVLGWLNAQFGEKPGSRIVRCVTQKAGTSTLVSSVRRNVVHEVSEACKQNRYRFRSCRPAILSELERQGYGTASRDARAIVYYEPALAAPRNPVVQMMFVERGQIAASWRAWIPPAASCTLGQEPAIVGAVERFRRSCSLPVGTPIEHVMWKASWSTTDQQSAELVV